MIRTALAAPLFVGALLLAAPSAAQTQQEQLDARYDRALAAGYKALMLCGGLAHSYREGFPRTADHIEQWELAGIQSPLDGVVASLLYSVKRFDGPDSQIAAVEVAWADDMPPRVAIYAAKSGCSLQPIGAPVQPPNRADDEPPAAMVSVEKAVGDTGAAAAIVSALSGAYGQGSRTTAVIVRRGDSLIEQGFATGFGPAVPQRTWSVAKSIASTLVGAAVQRGKTRVSDSAAIATGAIDPRAAITIDHLLRMASGRYSDTPGNRTDPLYYGGATVAETAAHWPVLHPPGRVFRYANNDTLMAVEAIEGTFAAHPPPEFFSRVGMRDTVAETDWQGSYILSSQVWSSARDLARFGQLYLDDGKLPDGTRILPEGWVQYVSSPSGPQPEGEFGYGAGFWLLNKSEGVPPDTFAAFGNRGQYVVIVPSRDVVIVRRGEDPVGSRFDIAAFTRDVLAALED
ncbi:serine hydrolase [Parerythrobacter aurantius]|uniref:serine hydrolase domain-containing protein n=1 Tax=Parerythrobacter aurantius TaxID=3127706 RepID=UPI0032449584